MKHFDLSDARIQEVLAPYCPAVNIPLCEQIRIYISTLLQWNSKISLTTVTEPNEILRVHFGESLFAGWVGGISSGRVADIGTGPGFPGIPIRMVSPRLHLSLVESVTKKIAFLGEIVRELSLSDVDIIRCRMEEWTPSRKLNIITVRALGKYGALLNWARSSLDTDGRVILLLGEGEVESLRRKIDWLWHEPIKIPRSKAKFVLIGSCVSPQI